MRTNWLKNEQVGRDVVPCSWTAELLWAAAASEEARQAGPLRRKFLRSKASASELVTLAGMDKESLAACTEMQ